MVKNYQKTLKQILSQIKPKPEEKKLLHSVAKKVFSAAKKYSRKYKAVPLLAGSITRDTWLPGKIELDCFVLFPPRLTVKQLEKAGLKVGKDVFTSLKGEYKTEYAQHPYVSGKIDSVEVDIVPSYAVKTTAEMKSAVDRTPFHVKYLKRHLPLKLSDQVRLLKQFLTANEIYGADAKTGGFSGYVCELMTVRFKSFLNVLKTVSSWDYGEIIDIEKFYSKKEYQNLRRQFKNHALILVDPTDKTRNTAAAISTENFFKFRKISREFLLNADSSLFFPRRTPILTENELIQQQLNRRTELLFVKFVPPSVVPDILWPQLRRFSDRLQSILEETQYEFKVLRKDSYTNEKDLAVVLLEMEVSKLPIIQKRIGPKAFDLEDSRKFVEKYKGHALNGPFIEDNSWVVEIRRRFVTSREKLYDSLKDDVKILKAKGIPNFIADQLAKGFEIFSENSKIMDLVKKDEGFGIFLKKYFERESLI